MSAHRPRPRNGPPADPLMSDIADRRRHLGITKAELGKDVGLSEGAVNSHESGARRPTIVQIRAYVDALAARAGLPARLRVDWDAVPLDAH